MPESSTALRLQARKTESLILRAMQETKQTVIADALACDEPTVSRLKAQLERISLLLTACGLKVVPLDSATYSKDGIEAVKTLARRALEADVCFDDETAGVS